MLTNISLIASIISALTAITTSLRALGKSRENSRNDSASKIKTSYRIGDVTGHKKHYQQHSLKIHAISTITWFVLSLVFAIPLFMQKWSEARFGGILVPAAVFAAVTALVMFIWYRAVNVKNQTGQTKSGSVEQS